MTEALSSAQLRPGLREALPARLRGRCRTCDPADTRPCHTDMEDYRSGSSQRRLQGQLGTAAPM